MWWLVAISSSPAAEGLCSQYQAQKFGDDSE